jgi:ATP-dependent DNA helicase RecQ
MALSCVYRSGQRFGVNYIIDILMGKDDERIQGNQHHQLSTFGIGMDKTAVEWRGIFRQLIAQGFLTADAESYGVLKLTEKARPLLRGELQLALRHQRKTKKTKKAKVVDSLSAEENVLFDALRDHRLTLARERSVPPYVIFHDSTLQAMAQQRPSSTDELRGISGIGDKKLNEYGESFLVVIASVVDGETESKEAIADVYID